jgi:hypothetical protein
MLSQIFALRPFHDLAKRFLSSRFGGGDVVLDDAAILNNPPTTHMVVENVRRFTMLMIFRPLV